nr:integrase, catalytic region, zinc finger, CCHC-type, peptidase aspartic, catalytic [Tanacetum cinerariifolium]
MFLTHSGEALEIEKFKRSRENKIEFAYDYGNLNAQCDKEENPKVIAPGMFKLSVSHSISPISIFRHFSSVRRPKNSDVVWKKKGSSNTFKVDLSVVRISNLNKNVKRYSRNDLLACNNSHLGETRSAFVCNDAMNVSCDSRMNDLLDDNNFFIFDDESVKISPVSKMPFRKKPRDSMNVRSKSNSNKSLPRAVYCPDFSLDHRFGMFKAYDGFYLLNDYEDLGKLKPNGDIGVFVGYSKESAAFRIYSKRTRKIHESVNVNFDEISEMASK